MSNISSISSGIIAAYFTATPVKPLYSGVVDVRGCVQIIDYAPVDGFHIDNDCNVIAYKSDNMTYTVTHLQAGTNGFISDTDCQNLINNVLAKDSPNLGTGLNGTNYGSTSSYGFNGCTPGTETFSSSSSTTSSSSSSSSSASHMSVRMSKGKNIAVTLCVGLLVGLVML